MHLGNTNTMQEHYWRSTGVFSGELGVCVVLPFYVPTSLPMSIVSASFLFFLQKGSLNQSNSFVRKVKATVCWHPDTRVRSGCIEKEWREQRMEPLILLFFFIVNSDWGEQPCTFRAALMIIIVLNIYYRWGCRSPSKCHSHCSRRPLCCYHIALGGWARWRGARGGPRKETKEAEEEAWGLSSFKCQK